MKTIEYVQLVNDELQMHRIQIPDTMLWAIGDGQLNGYCNKFGTTYWSMLSEKEFDKLPKPTKTALNASALAGYVIVALDDVSEIDGMNIGSVDNITAPITGRCIIQVDHNSAKVIEISRIHKFVSPGYVNITYITADPSRPHLITNTIKYRPLNEILGNLYNCNKFMLTHENSDHWWRIATQAAVESMLTGNSDALVEDFTLESTELDFEVGMGASCRKGTQKIMAEGALDKFGKLIKVW